jgi:hypothetical protein
LAHTVPNQTKKKRQVATIIYVPSSQYKYQETPCFVKLLGLILIGHIALLHGKRAEAQKIAWHETTRIKICAFRALPASLADSQNLDP